MDGRVTGIGSLPQTDPVDAVRFVAELCPEIPFWPQLPRRSVHETMVDQALGGVEGLLDRRRDGSGFELRPESCGELLDRLEDGAASLDRSHAAGFFAFEEALHDGVFSRAVSLKGQVAGPVTSALQIFDGDRALAGDPVFLPALAQWIAGLAVFQIERLSRAGPPVMIFVDEPCLGMVDPGSLTAAGSSLENALRTVVGAIRDSGSLAGLHCCAPFPLAVLSRIKPDIVSFDAHTDLGGFLSDPGAAAYVRGGGAVSFGLIPTTRWLADSRGAESGDTTEEEIAKRFLAAMAAAPAMEPGFPPLGDMLRRSLVTATCGLAFLDESEARASFERAHGVSRRLREAISG